jgi:predicted small integral membrane protein
VVYQRHHCRTRRAWADIAPQKSTTIRVLRLGSFRDHINRERTLVALHRVTIFRGGGDCGVQWAVCIGLVAFGNIIDCATNFGGTPGEELDPDIMWRAISRAAVWNIAYVALIVRESLTAIALLTAVVLWIFFAGFLDIGGEWFSTWRSSAWNGLDPAFRNSVLAMITLVLIHTTSPAWVKRHDSMSTGSNPMVH